MDRHHTSDQVSRSSKPSLVRADKGQQPPKLNISYLLNDPTNDEKSDKFMRQAQSSRDLRIHRSKPVAGSSRRLHVSSAVRDRFLDRPDRPAPPSVQPLPAHPALVCQFCSEPFQHVSLLEEHKRMYHLAQVQAQAHQRTRTFVCDECGTSFSEKGNLNRHIKSVHKKEKPWPCPRCNNNFAFRDALNRHVDAVHLDLRPYSCTECIAKFKKRAHLQRHMATCHRSSVTQPSQTP